MTFPALSKVQSVDQRMRLGMRCRLSPTADVPLDVEHGFVFRRSLHREVGWFLAFQDAVDVGGGKPIQRGLINPEGDQSTFGDETAEVMGSNGAMIVPQDIKPKQTVRQDFDKV